MAAGSFALAEELFARGDAAFVAELRRVHDAERLANFAARWLADARPIARNFLHEYLGLPLNAYRHEGLVKRLFKGAEKKNDDEIMGWFLVAFDRSMRRQRKPVARFKQGNFTSRGEAEAQVRVWRAEGYENEQINSYSGRFYAYATKREEVIVAPANTMPRPPESAWKKNQTLHDAYRQRLEKRCILFTPATRRYLRRRAWRWFRKFGKTDLARYRAGALKYLKLYRDEDVDSDIHLLDNWGLVHTLFGESPALVRPARGWEFAEGKSLADLTPAPRFADAWRGSRDALWDLLLAGRCRTVRQWAMQLLHAWHDEWLKRQPVEALLRLTDHADPDVAALGFELLEGHADLASVPVEAWLTRLDADDLEKLQRLSSLLERRLDPARVSLRESVKLALHRSLPVARLGFTLLQKRAAATESDLPELLPLVQAGSASVRPQIVGWLRETLMRSGTLRSEWLLEFLDSKHADVRAVGWNWLQESPLKDEPTLWHRLLESPYDDIRGPLIAALTDRVRGAEPDAVRMLWATVLLNIKRGGRYKPGVVSQIAERLASVPLEANRLLPLLAIAVRSLRGPEFRAGLSGVVQLYDSKEELRPAIARQFPELVVTS